MTTITKDKPQIYVADLSAYNSGYLHGQWIDATLSAEEIESAVREIMLCSPVEDAEEWAIHDYQDFGGFEIEEYDSFETVSELANLVTDNEFPAGLLAEVHKMMGFDTVAETITYMNDNYQGVHESLGHWAEYYLEETGQLESVPKELRYYIDVDKYGRDRDLEGSIHSFELSYNEVHVFWA